MAKKFWGRRNLAIAGIVVVLSIGLVFASVPYLPTSPTSHGQLTNSQTINVEPGSANNPTAGAIRLQNLKSTENFWVNVTVSYGTASLCVIKDIYWNTYRVGNQFPTTDCVAGTPTAETSQMLLKFVPPSDGTWFIAALNSGSSRITVVFLPA